MIGLLLVFGFFFVCFVFDDDGGFVGYYFVDVVVF